MNMSDVNYMESVVNGMNNKNNTSTPVKRVKNVKNVKRVKNVNRPPPPDDGSVGRYRAVDDPRTAHCSTRTSSCGLLARPKRRAV